MDETVQNAGQSALAARGPLQDPWVARLKGSAQVRDEAIDELRTYLLRGLSRLMSSRYGGEVSAEDAVQEALVKILSSIDQFAGRSRFTTWAMTVATRIGISEMRRRHYQNTSIDSFKTAGATFEVAEQVAATVSTEIDRQHLVTRLQKIIDASLSEKQRFAIRATLAGLPIEVIAEKSGSNTNSVYKLVHDARQKLRRAMEASGISESELAEIFA